MARDYAQIRLDIWGDDDFRALTPAAQHLYLVLTTDPSLSYAGVADWRPARIASKAKDWTPVAVNAAASELAAKLFIVVDEATEEVLVRSFIKHDGLMKNPRMAVSMLIAYAGVASQVLRGVIVYEVAKLRSNAPDLSSWDHSISRDRLTDMLRREAIDPAVFPTGYPRGNGGVTPCDSGLITGSVTPSVTPSVKGFITPKPTPWVKGFTSPAPTPAPTPSNSNELLQESAPRERDAEPEEILDAELDLEPTPVEAKTPGRKRSAPGTRITEDWVPTRDAVDKLRPDVPDVDLRTETANFVDYWLGVPGAKGVKADWLATWRKWMRKAQADATGNGRPRVLSFRERQHQEAQEDFHTAIANGDPNPMDPYALIDAATAHTALGRGA